MDRLRATMRRMTNPAEEGESTATSKLRALRDHLMLGRKGTASPAKKEFVYAVLPDGETLEGWTNAEREELDDIVRHMLHSRRARLKRSMQGFLKYVQRRKFMLPPSVGERSGRRC
jgi:hypothetical protein